MALGVLFFFGFGLAPLVEGCVVLLSFVAVPEVSGRWVVIAVFILLVLVTLGVYMVFWFEF